MRIVSLLPSATDIVVALGASSELVGVSHSCSGDWAHLPKLTSTWLDTRVSSADIDLQVRDANRPLYRLDIATLEILKPDVVISQSLCDVCAVPSGDVEAAVRELPSAPVLIDLTPHRLNDVPKCFTEVGRTINREPEAVALLRQWHTQMDDIHNRYVGSGLRVALLDWLDPPFAAGHWVPDMLEWLGVESALGVAGERSFETTWEAVTATKPDMVIAACCGFDEARTVAELNANIGLPLIVLDGHRHFSRPSPALLPSFQLLMDAIDGHLVARDA